MAGNGMSHNLGKNDVLGCFQIHERMQFFTIYQSKYHSAQIRGGTVEIDILADEAGVHTRHEPAFGIVSEEDTRHFGVIGNIDKPDRRGLHHFLGTNAIPDVFC